jgi:hypothetical protein
MFLISKALSLIYVSLNSSKKKHGFFEVESCILQPTEKEHNSVKNKPTGSISLRDGGNQARMVWKGESKTENKLYLWANSEPSGENLRACLDSVGSNELAISVVVKGEAMVAHTVNVPPLAGRTRVADSKAMLGTWGQA